MIKQEDIAKLAGVSRSTVARVLNECESVKEETRNKVLAVIKENGYEKNYLSSTLASKKEKIIYAFIVKSRVSYYSEELKKGLQKIQDENKSFSFKINIIETSIDNPWEQLGHLKNILKHKKVSGIIITPLLKDEILKIALKNPNIQFISLDISLSDDIPHIGANYYKSGKVAGDIMSGLLRTGEKCLVFRFSSDRISSEDYYNGFLDALNGDQVKVIEGDKDLTTSYSEIKKHITADIRGIFSNRYITEITGILEINNHLFQQKIIGIAGNPTLKNYVKTGMLHSSVNEQYSEIGYTSGKIMFESLYKGKIEFNKNYIDPVVLFKSLV